MFVLKHLGGKIAPKLVYFVLKKELLNFSESIDWRFRPRFCTVRRNWDIDKLADERNFVMSHAPERLMRGILL